MVCAVSGTGCRTSELGHGGAGREKQSRDVLGTAGGGVCAVDWERRCSQEVYRRYRETLLPDQEAVDGSFPKELARTKPYSYSIFNFDVMAGLCQSLGIWCRMPRGFALADGRGIKKGSRVHLSVSQDKSAWKWAKDVEHLMRCRYGRRDCCLRGWRSKSSGIRSCGSG